MSHTPRGASPGLIRWTSCGGSSPAATGCGLWAPGTRSTGSPTPRACLSVAGLPPAVAVAADRGSVSVPAGLRYGELARHLRGHGLAMPNLGSLPHISVGGACATGTHGSGDRNGCLSTAVSALELVTADGDLLTLRRGVDEEFAGAVVGLGR